MISNSRRFFYDCEFYEHDWSVELISIGISNSDKSRTLYLENKDFNWYNLGLLAQSRTATRREMETPRWLIDNVYPHIIYRDGKNGSVVEGDNHIRGAVSINYMAQMIQEFVGGPSAKPRFYGWYSAYDHFCLANIFGRMIDLPGNFPMYTRDLKQMADETDMFEKVNYPPKPDVVHNALGDAMWNADMYDAIMKQRTENNERAFWARFSNEIAKDYKTKKRSNHENS
jgi:hypothetical protein